MKRNYLCGAAFAALAAAAAAVDLPAAAQDAANDALREVIIVRGARAPSSALDVETPDAHPLEGADVTLLLSRTPGGARVGNGALSGQVQYRGLFGPRINARVDGQRFAYACPNLMDPPFHNAPSPLVAALEIDRGVSPVRAGPGLAGGVNARLARVDFAEADVMTFGYDVSLAARSADESVAVGGVAGAASDAVRFNAVYAFEQGDDYAFPGGVAGGTEYERLTYGAAFGLRPADGQELSLDLRRMETGLSGAPSLPMDIVFVDTDSARLAYEGAFGGLGVDASLGWSSADHLMSNVALRPDPGAMRRRESDTTASIFTSAFALTIPMGGGQELRLGVDSESVERDAVISNPSNDDFYIGFLPDIALDRYGAYAEWTGDLGFIEAELGARVDAHEHAAGVPAIGPAVPAGPTALAEAFAAADRTVEDTTYDLVARGWRDLGEGFTLRATLARKTRVPQEFERFAWLPSNATGGLADGNIYVGDLDLAPETAWIAEAGFDLQTERAYLRPTVFYRQVDDYIQGVPFDATPGVADSPQEMIAAMNGDPTPLRFANVDARLYGVDLDAGYRLSPRWRADAVMSYVRGERRDIDDNLYRVAPPSLTVGLTHERAAWSATVETRLVAEQSDVSATNDEAQTAGYALLNLYGDWRIGAGARLSAGVENLLDHAYDDHLAGYNRNAGSDVAVGARMPGAGRGAFVRLTLAR